MTTLPVAEWLPDQPAIGNPGASVLHSALPRTATSYGPMPSLAVYSSALTARCQGAYPFLDTSANVNLFAGDATKLYRATASSASFSDVSGGTYTISADQHWQFAQYGQRVMATNIGDGIQGFLVGTASAFSLLAAAAPKARYIATIRDFIFVANTYDASSGYVPQMVWWGAIDDPTNWPTPGSAAAQLVQSDQQQLAGDGGWNQGIVGGLAFADGAVFQERKIWTISYAGPPVFFAFRAVEGARGTPAPNSIVQLGAIVYYLGEDGFYAFDGMNSRPIGANKVDKTFFGELDQSYFHRIYGAVDPINKQVFWAYPATGHANGNPNRMVVYNWSLDKWGYVDDSAFAIEYLMRSLSFGNTLESLDSISSSLDALPFSLDSRVYTGGRVLLAAFDTNHKLNYFTGSAYEAQVETNEIEFTPSRRSFYSSSRPIVDGGSPTVALITRDRINDAATTGSFIAQNTQGECPQRTTGRYVKARLKIPAGSTWTHAEGIEIMGRPEGSR